MDVIERLFGTACTLHLVPAVYGITGRVTMATMADTGIPERYPARLLHRTEGDGAEQKPT